MTVISFDKIIICIFEVVMFYDFLRDALSKRFERKSINFLFYCITFILWYLINSVNNSVINLIGIPAMLFGVAFFQYEDEIRKLSMYILIFWTIMIGIEFISGLVYMRAFHKNDGIFDGYKNDGFLVIVLMKIATYIILKIISLFILKAEMGIKGKLFAYALILPITTMLLFAGMFYANINVGQNIGILSIGCVMLLFTNIVVFFILEDLTIVLEHNKAFEVEKMQYELYQSYYERIEEINAKTKQFIHNEKEYLATIKRMAMEKDNSGILDIINDIEINLKTISNKSYSDNKIINALLSEKEQLAIKNKIDMSISTEPNLRLDFINSGDIILMLGNLIQNALEAAKKCEKGYVNVCINGSEGGFIVIIVENNYHDDIKNHNERYLSSKRGYREYGLGIRCVEETVKKYGGILFLQHGDNIFKAILTISKNYVG